MKKTIPALLLIHVLGLTASEPGMGATAPPEYDIVFKGARVIDPETGLDSISNIAIKGKLIAAITPKDITGKTVFHAHGLIAAPGFIDLHAHGQDPYSEKLGVLDGKTSQLDLEAGALPVSSYYAYKNKKSISNYGASVGHAFARVLVMDGIDSHGIGLMNNTLERTAETGNQWASTVATDEQLDRIDELVVQGLNEGGLGIGIMVGYYPRARSDGLARIARIAKQHNAFLTAHSRYISLSQPSGLLGIQEMIALATSYDVPLLVHHLPTNALADTETVLNMIDSANRNGANIVGEMFPYDRGSTFIATEILDEGWQTRMDMDYEDLSWVETGETLTKETFDRYRRVRPEGLFIMKHIKEKDMLLALVHPDVIIASDGTVYVDKQGEMLPAEALFGAGQGHPRGAGTYGRYLRMAIEDGRLSMPQILAKTSYQPARLIENIAPSMKRRGRLQVNAYADITFFDPEKVTGVADYKPGTNSLPSKGFVYVLVNGKIVVKKGALAGGVFPGEPIRGEILNTP
jgi:hypothetical protein